jgi:arylsulfatase A-like enzyme
LPTRHGFEHYFGLPYSNDMGGSSDGKDKKGLKKYKWPLLPLLRDERVIETVSPKEQSKLTERYTVEAAKFIKAHKEKPFFLYLAHTAVHDPHHPGAAFRGKSKNGVYGDWVEEVDASAGRVLDVLRELKIEGRTLVLFTSDNGGTRAGINAPFRGYKHSTLEGGVREPTIAWQPGKVTAKSTCDAVAANFDLLPTFVKLAGGSVPKDRRIDGKDIWPLLNGKTKKSPHEVLYYFRGNVLDAVRSGPWKLQIKEGRLYNLERDPDESSDVAKDNPERVKKLGAFVEKMRGDLGVDKPGPGCRAPGRVKEPRPLLLNERKRE